MCVSVCVCRCLKRSEEDSTCGCVYLLTWVLGSELRFSARGPALSASFQPTTKYFSDLKSNPQYGSKDAES